MRQCLPYSHSSDAKPPAASISALSKISSYYDWWLFEGFRVSAEGLALFRVAYALFLLAFGMPSYRWISAYPDAFFQPPVGLPFLLEGFPPAFVFEGLSLAVPLLAVLLLVGYRTKAVSILLTLTAITALSFQYSFGKIDHGATIFFVLPLVMAFSGWGRRLSIDARRAEEGPPGGGAVQAWPLAVMATIIGVGFLSAGLPKYVGWIDFDLTTQGVRDWVFTAYYDRGKDALLLPYMVQVESPVFWEVMDVTGVAFELGFFLSLAWPPAFRAYLCLAVLFHVGNYLMLNIAFVMFFPIYMLFLPWTAIAERLRASGALARVNALMRLRTAVLVAVVYVPLAWWAGSVVPPSRPATPLALLVYPLPVAYHTVLAVVVFAAGLCVVAWATARTLREWRKEIPGLRRERAG